MLEYRNSIQNYNSGKKLHMPNRNESVGDYNSIEIKQ